MAWRFRKSIKVIPGVRINLSSRGISTTIGGRGASVNISGRGTYFNASIPGTGLSYREKIGGPASSHKNGYLPQPAIPQQETWLAEPLDNILSLDVQEVTSQDMEGIKQALLWAHEQKKELKSDLSMVSRKLVQTKTKHIIGKILLFSLYNKPFIEQAKQDIDAQRETIEALTNAIESSTLEVQIEFDDDLKLKYQRTANAFRQLTGSARIWDVTGSYTVDRVTTRSAASESIKRTAVRIAMQGIDDIKCDYPAFYFQNANGADLYFYPDFIVMYRNRQELGIIGYHEIKIDFCPVRFVEDGSIPSDSKIIDYTWLKVNKNGSPDRRFKNNRQIPIVRYGDIELSTRTGIHERFEFSNFESCQQFAASILDYQKTITSLKRIRG